MASTINATTSSGIVATADNTGSLALQSAGTTIMTITSTGVTTQVGAPAFSAYTTTNQSFTATTYTKVTFDLEEYDTNSNFASSRFTPTVAGYYQLSVALSNNASDIRMIAAIYKNGASYKILQDATSSPNNAGGSVLVYANGTTDYYETYVWMSVSSGTPQLYGTQATTWFTGAMVRSA